MTSIASSDHHVTGRRNLRLLLRNKRRDDRDSFGATGTVLCVHSATYPATVTFDYPVQGHSWLDILALQGFDAWCLDLAGYGGSERPPEMAADPMAAEPLVDTAWAAEDAATAVDYILALRGLPRLNLLGYSWGTAITGTVAGRMPERIARLILYGALWLAQGDRLVPADQKLGAYRTVTEDAIAARWLQKLTAEQAMAVAEASHIRTWARAAVASDPASTLDNPGLLRAPTGVVHDVRRAQARQAGLYDPGRIRCPTMIAVGEWDAETTPEQGRAVFGLLERAAERRMVVLGRGTHTLLLEHQRHALHAVVTGFLNEGRATPE